MFQKIRSAWASGTERFGQLFAKWGRIPLIAALCVVMATSFTVLRESIQTFSIADGQNQYLIRSVSKNLSVALASANLPSENYRVVSAKSRNNQTFVEIEYLFPVYLTVGDVTKTVSTPAKTVREILTDAGYTPDGYDLVQPSLDTFVSDTVYIDYVNIDYTTGSYTETIPHKTETVYSRSAMVGEQSVEEGHDGLQQVNYTVKFVNGQFSEQVVDSVQVLSKAVNTKITVGTKMPGVTTSDDVNCVSTIVPETPIELDANGVPVDYVSSMTVQATAYTYTGHRCSTGRTPQPGCVAVNPNVIPYGTRMYIVSADGKYVYGYAIAADTGGFTRKHPNNVDLFFGSQSACKSFGRRNVKIYILP